MLKTIIKSFFVAAFIISPVFANDANSAFHQQEDINYPNPDREEDYFATLAPMKSGGSGYFGFNLGGNMIPLKSEIAVTSSGTLMQREQRKDTFGLNIGIYDGYGFNINHFYIGGELNASFNAMSKTISDKVNGKDIELSVRQPLMASFDIIPGYMSYSKDILVYGRVGIGGSLFRLNFSDNTTELKVESNKSNKASFGWRAGVGIDYFVNDLFSIRTEYVYTKYRKIDVDYTASSVLYDYALKGVGLHQINLGFSIHY